VDPLSHRAREVLVDLPLPWNAKCEREKRVGEASTPIERETRMRGVVPQLPPDLMLALLASASISVQRALQSPLYCGAVLRSSCWVPILVLRRR